MKAGLRDTYSSYIDLVLVGGGHAQVQALKSFGMKPEAGIRLTLITDVLNTPYSGMLPGHIAVSYTHLTLPTICSV